MSSYARRGPALAEPYVPAAEPEAAMEAAAEAPVGMDTSGPSEAAAAAPSNFLSKYVLTKEQRNPRKEARAAAVAVQRVPQAAVTQAAAGQ